MRPLGVTLSACFQFLRGLLLALLAAGILLAGGLTSHLAALADQGNLQRLFSGLGHFLGIALLAYAAIQIILGIGLLLGQSWARHLTIIFCALGFLLLLPRLLHMHIFALFFGIAYLAVVIYLLMPEARSYFARGNA